MAVSKKKFILGLVGVLVIANFFIWVAVFAAERDVLTVSFLDVGQGDAIFIESPTGIQIIVDGGPDNGVLAKLSSQMPFYDRFLDMLIVTNPDKDHFAGFIDVLKKYRVGNVMEPGTVTGTAIYKEFEKAVKSEGAARVLARRGTILNLGGGAYLQILFPDRDVSGLSTNDGSIVAKLVYKNTSLLLMGDAPDNIEKYLAMLDGKNLDVDVLKLGHHGSKTSSSVVLLAATTPDYAIISAGKNNRYGHPHQEVTDRLASLGIKTMGTYENGTIVLKSNGDNIWVD